MTRLDDNKTIGALDEWTTQRIALQVHCDTAKFEADLGAWLSHKGINGLDQTRICAAAVSAYRQARKGQLEAAMAAAMTKGLETLFAEIMAGCASDSAPGANSKAGSEPRRGGVLPEGMVYL